MNEFLQQLSAYYSDDYLILVMDNATWHKSQALELPENITCTFIPPYTPEMNPIEQVWAEIRKRGFKNKAFKSLEEVILKLETVIQNLETECLRRIVHRKWICPEQIFGEYQIYFCEDEVRKCVKQSVQVATNGKYVLQFDNFPNQTDTCALKSFSNRFKPKTYSNYIVVDASCGS